MTERNIGPRECRKRLTWGAGMLLFSLFYFFLLLMIKPPAIWWTGLLLTTFIGLMGILQAIEKTCIVLAADGVHFVADTRERQAIQDPHVVKFFRQKANRILIHAALLAILIVAFLMLVPKGS